MSFVAVGFNPLNHSRTEFIVYSGFHHFICEERVATARDGGHAPGTDRLVERENMYSMVVTQDTSQSPIGWLKEQWVSHVIASNEDTPLELSDQKANRFCVSCPLTMQENIGCRMSAQAMNKRHSSFLTPSEHTAVSLPAVYPMSHATTKPADNDKQFRGD